MISRDHLVLGGWTALLAGASWLLVSSTGPVLGELAGPVLDPGAAVAGTALLAGWLVLAWLTLQLAATLAESIGVRSARHLARFGPATVRMAVRASLGLGLASSVLPLAPASASLAAPTAQTQVLGDHPRDRWPSLDRPGSPTQASRPPGRTYVVTAGDTLWSIAADHLRPGASDAEIAVAWPDWWAANRRTVGADPGLIRPGQRLREPRIDR